jgi:hypothetical protein
MADAGTPERDEELIRIALAEMRAFKARFPGISSVNERAIVQGIAATWVHVQADALRLAARNAVSAGLQDTTAWQMWLGERADDIERSMAEILAVRSW